jgi:GNAT superfamily N-acetyltransferase
MIQSALENSGNDITIRVRPAVPHDTDAIVAIDARVTGVEKIAYWHDLLDRYLGRRTEDRFVLVAEGRQGADVHPVVGFVIGEVRAWEFGSEPCGWVFAVSVEPDWRLAGVGTQLLKAIETRFRAAGVVTMRTILSRKNHLLMSFFRSHGMTAGPYIELEKAILDGETEP